MAAKNQNLYDALNNDFKKLNSLNPVLRQEAFEALLQVDAADVIAFKNAIFKHKSFWNEFLPQLTNSPFIEGKGTTPTFAEIQKKAAEQFVLLGLKTLPESELQAIFEATTEDACRDKLETLNVFDPWTSSQSWQTDRATALPDTNKIQTQAAMEFLLNRMSQPIDIDTLESYFINANPVAKETALTALGIPPQAHRFLIPVPTTIEKETKLAELSLTAFKNHIATLPDSKIIDEGKKIKDHGLFNTSVDDALGINFPHRLHFDGQPQGKEAEEFFLTRYLESQLNTKTFDDLENTLKADDATLKTVPDADLAYCVDTLPKSKLRETLFKEFFKKCDADSIKPKPPKNLDVLTDLSNQTNLNGFKTTLTNHGFQSDSITEESMKIIQKDARDRAFAIKSGGQSLLLQEAFSRLSDNAQRDLLAQPDKLKRAINFHTKADLKKHFAGALSDAEAQAILDEKTSLKAIHNSQVAKILSEVKPPIQWKVHNPDMAEKINQKFTTRGMPYVQFVDDLVTICDIQPANVPEFKKSFGFPPGQPFIPDVYNAIDTQQNYNAILIDQYHAVPAVSASDKKLIQLLLNIDKTQPFTQANFDHIKDRLKNAANFEAFLKSLNTAEYKSFQTQLASSFVAFKEIKKLARGELIASTTDENQLETELINIRQEVQQYESDHLRPIKNVKEILNTKLASAEKMYYAEYKRQGEQPSFLERVANKFTSKLTYASQAEENYKNMAKDCNTYLQNLHRQLAVLNDYIDPKKNYLPESKLKSSLPKAVKYDLRRQRDEIELLIREYEILQKKLNDINDAIFKARHGENLKTYVPNGYVTSIQEKDEAYVPPVQNTMAAAVSFGVDEEEEEKQHADLNDNQTRTYTSIDSKAYFTEEVKTQRDGSKRRFFKMDGFPPKDDSNGNKARVEFALNLAMTILSNIKNPPPKDKSIQLVGNQELLKYLVPALRALQDTKYMKFDVNKATTVIGGDYKPDSNWFETKSNSVYEREFKPLMAPFQEQFAQMMEDKFNPEPVEVSNKALGGELNKDKLNEFKKEIHSKEKKAEEQEGLMIEEKSSEVKNRP